MERDSQEINSTQPTTKPPQKKKNFLNKMLSAFCITTEPREKKEKKKEKEMQNDKTMWVPDEKAQTCYNCQKQFSAIFLRKHHCRICGNVFCKDCSRQNVDGKYWGSKKEIKVCDYCFEMYKKLDETLVETTIENNQNLIEDIDSINDNIKNLKRETKLSEYCKKARRENEDAYSFLERKDKRYEDACKDNIDNLYSELVKYSIQNVLKNESAGLYERWNEKIAQLAKIAISQVNPSFRDLKDSLNINDYIKIKTISYKDQSQSRVIDGFAMQKNVSSKKMNISIQKPKILLLDCGLDYSRDPESVTTIENIMTQEAAYLEIIKRKIEQVEPDIILVNKNVARKLQEDFAQTNKIALVMNVKSESLKKIARCTKTYVLPSTDLIDKQTILGTCEKFKIEKIKSSGSTELLKTNEYNLMIFEGCDYLLHCTIILSGPDESELKRVKKIFRETILQNVRDLYQQKYMLYFFNMDIPKFGEIELEANQTKQFEGQKEEEWQTTCRDFQYGFDTSLLSENVSNFFVVTLILSQGIPLLPGGLDKISQEQIGTEIPQITNGNDLAESEVLKMINSICEEPAELEMKFYCNDYVYDKPLGKLIIDICAESETKCEICRKQKANHLYYMYRNTGRLKIQMILKNTDDQLDKVIEFINKEVGPDALKPGTEKNDKDNINYNIDIFSYGFCRICQKVVTPLCKLPKEIFNFSVSRYFKNLLLNHEIRNRSDNKEFNISNSIASTECCHYANKDISRIFITKMGSIKFLYENSPKYLIEYAPLIVKRDAKQASPVLENYLKNAREKCIDILSAIKANFISCFEEISKPDKEKEVYFSVPCEKIQMLIKEYIAITENVTAFADNLFALPPKFEDYVKAIIYIKKVYFRIVQVKLINNHVRKLIQKIKKYLYNISKRVTSANSSGDRITPGGIERQNSFSSLKNVILSNESDTLNMTNIDNKDSYKSILQEISFYDENHSMYSSDIHEDDISSIIAYTLASDNYREFISQRSPIKLLENKLEKKTKNISPDATIYFRETIAENGNVMMMNQNKSASEMENKVGYSYFNSQDEELYETSLLFDQMKNSYTDSSLDNSKLETELFNSENLPFTYTTSSLNLQMLTTSMQIEYNPSKKRTDIKSKEKTSSAEFNAPAIFALAISESNTLDPCEEKHVLPADDIKKTLEEIEARKKEIKEIKERVYLANEIKTKYKFQKVEYLEDNLFAPECEIGVYYPRQFEALRTAYCSTYDEFILSIAKSAVWTNVTGGKSKANFYKSHDNKFILKCVNKHEFKMFLETGFQYFHHNAKFLFHKMPSALAKILGAYKIKIKNNKLNKTENSYVILMENLFYCKDLSNNSKNIRAYDLKGSKLNRYISKKDLKPNQVLPDTNFKEDFKGEPLNLDKKMAELLKSAVHNDSLILSKMNVIDYSLLLIIEDQAKVEMNVNDQSIVLSPQISSLQMPASQCPNIKTIRLGIIDYLRKYTWDKQLEHVGKTLINRLQAPTIINPINYKERFKEAMADYFIGL